jgi:putative PIN family toxin of toxin-antitoxin system
LRVFLDTNVLFAALATRGLCADLLRALLAEHEVLVGEPVLAELRRNLARKLRMPPAIVEAVLAFLGDLERAPAARPLRPLPRGVDAADAAILACAALATAEVFLTGDRALLALRRYEGYAILAPRELWERMRRKP